jgi:hypothetical protein
LSVSDVPGCITPVVVDERAELRESDTAAVGQHEEASPLVGRSHVRSTKADGCACVPFALERREDIGKSPSCASDVLPKDEGGVALGGDAESLKEEAASGTVEPGSLAGDGEVLAGTAESDAIHDATPRAAVEGDNVVPDRSRCQGRLFHPGHEAGRREGFPLDVHHSPSSAPGCKVDSEVEPASTGEEAGNTEDGR